ncbi:MAG: tRNA-specific adenosine deaminase [Alphaproteobacteria bacterium ADurb.Bin438]|nr:MAG: tRNA-specific adenosine deaminase [Alphaproteobacteria bacterium ADurb.Bin438]
MLRKIIDKAFECAFECLKRNDIPIGAVVFDLETLEIISFSGNKVELNKNPLHHAEILALNQAFEVLNDKNLENCGIYATLEPCSMCMGAISHAHIKKVFFGAYQNQKLIKEHKPEEILGGFSEEKSKELIKSFFKNLRDENNS